MRFRAAALIFRRLGVAGSAAATGSEGPPVSQVRSSAILASSFSFWASIPKIAAFTISVVSFPVGILLDLPRFFHRKGDAVIHATPTRHWVADLPTQSRSSRNPFGAA